MALNHTECQSVHNLGLNLTPLQGQDPELPENLTNKIRELAYGPNMS